MIRKLSSGFLIIARLTPEDALKQLAPLAPAAWLQFGAKPFLCKVNQDFQDLRYSFLF